MGLPRFVFAQMAIVFDLLAGLELVDQGVVLVKLLGGSGSGVRA